ncbi:putative cell wall biogenesis protein phosphatase protein [Neofusicoccum parvum UCRNP2]|uniref:Putative cell wall biogenesis protein phosphatase protein n=1 Tax=Botryosphaeria parva (strain UCR-NP2) TaxID=1287680 RepID=R1EVM6_BOTPV|nr:putative cell wall biogenesis protein phosphatase protein [Neofusicoccum parvum UCRNP2]
MMEQLAIAQQIEALQQQQQQIAATHQQYVNMGMIPPQQHLAGQQFPMQGQMQNMQHANFQFAQQGQQQHLGVPMNAPVQGNTHRRNQSAMPNMTMGPPPAPSSGTSGFGEFQQQQQQNQGRENVNPRGGRGGSVGGGHTRRHSLALPEAKKAAELAEQKRKTSGFQFPIPGASGASSSTERSGSPASTQSGDQLKPAGRAMGHGRSQSMAVGNGRGGPRGGGNFQFPPPQATNDGGAGNDFQRRGSGHNRSSSRNFEGNWRQPQNQQQQQNAQDQQSNNMGNFSLNQATGAAPFQPGHRQRASMSQSVSSIGNFQYNPQPQLLQLPQGQVMMQPQMFGQGLNPLQLAQLQALQAAQMNGQGMGGLQGSQHAPQMSMQQQQSQQQRKTLFTPYLPQATLPALLSDGQLVAGILRVNKKNRSDAYVTTQDLDADIFICGSKDRNRALEGDYVAVELLDVDEVWSQKREKEEKKKRKDNTDRSSSIAVNDATTQPETGGADGGIRRRGSLRQRPTQKKNDDVEVEGQSLLLMEEEEINDEQKPLYAGHIVAVIERVAGQMFSGTLGLLRPSSQATKEKQEAERAAREGGSGRQQPERQQDKPKIVWFKPTDKRVPLIAIPTEQAPRDFVEKHQDYANRIFVACIKRWPITSLHPFGTLVEQLGEMGDLRVETDALLRDNNFGPDDFSDAVLRNVGFEDWSVANDGEAALETRRDFRDEQTFTIDPNGSKDLDDAIHFKTLEDGNLEIGIHVADVAHFVKANSLVDREAKKRGTAVYLMNRAVSMLPSRLSSEILCLSPGEERYTVSVVFKVDPATGKVFEDDTYIGKGIIKSSGKLSYDQVDAIISGRGAAEIGDKEKDVQNLHFIAQKFRQSRFGNRSTNLPSLRLLYQLDDENVPVEENIFTSSPSHELIEELSHKANAAVAQLIHSKLGDKALLRRHAGPNPRRLQTFVDRMTAIGYEIDPTSSGTLQSSLFEVEDPIVRQGMETLLVKTMQRAKYFVAGKQAEDGWSHYALNLPLYTHFTNPSRRYADIIVHRQLEAALSNGAIEFTEDIESLHKTTEMANTKKDSAHNAQEQSVHIESCRKMDKTRQEIGGDLISEGIVLCVYESAFDILIPEFGFEKRVHCDQLPLKKAEFDKNKRILELYWEKGVPSSTYIPEDERPKHGSLRGHNAVAAAREAEAAKQAAKEKEEAQRRNMDTNTMSADDVDALFDDDDDAVSDLADMTSGVSLNQTGADRPTQSMPPSPTRTGLMASEHAPHRTKSDPKISQSASDGIESKLSNKEKYLKLFTLREENGDYIQDVKEMTRVPVILKTDLTKSPPCLTIRSLNPYAL